MCALTKMYVNAKIDKTNVKVSNNYARDYFYRAAKKR